MEAKDLLSRFFMEKASAEMDNLFEQKGWTEEKINEWAIKHMRTSYNKTGE
ncbi:MAG: hypothetical protein LBE82_07910 [Chitinophagaceae bacterium]|nr:hypothetical protein [Chitinophagaceae bacterium]